jgi:hypothetical protein
LPSPITGESGVTDQSVHRAELHRAVHERHFWAADCVLFDGYRILPVARGADVPPQSRLRKKYEARRRCWAMRFDFVVLVVLLNGCVCLQPVDEFPDVGTAIPDGGRDASIELPVTSFIAPVPFEDIGDRESEYWRYLTPSLRLPSRNISWTENGELLVDAVGGVILADAGYRSAATALWRAEAQAPTHSLPHWMKWRGEWYRYTYPNDASRHGPFQLWHLNRITTQLELITTTSEELDAGPDPYNQFYISAMVVSGGTQMMLHRSVWYPITSEYVVGTMEFSNDVAELSSPRVFDVPDVVMAQGVDGDTTLLWTWNKKQQFLLRLRGNDLTRTTIDADCVAPLVQPNAQITMACASDAGVDAWLADRDGARRIGRNEVSPEQPEYLSFPIRLNPYLSLFWSETDAGTAMLQSCDSEHCHELLEIFATPPNVGVDDAGALFIADYIRDAGVRITRFAPGAW